MIMIYYLNSCPEVNLLLSEANRLIGELNAFSQIIPDVDFFPILRTKDIAALLSISASTANRLIVEFVRLGILEEYTGYKRNRKFIFREYVDLFK